MEEQMNDDDLKGIAVLCKIKMLERACKHGDKAFFEFFATCCTYAGEMLEEHDDYVKNILKPFCLNVWSNVYLIGNKVYKLTDLTRYMSCVSKGNTMVAFKRLRKWYEEITEIVIVEDGYNTSFIRKNSMENKWWKEDPYNTHADWLDENGFTFRPLTTAHRMCIQWFNDLYIDLNTYPLPGCFIDLVMDLLNVTIPYLKK